MKNLSFLSRAIIKIAGGSHLLKQAEAISPANKSENGWTRLTDRGAKGLSLPARDKQLDMAFTLWLTNGLAKRVIEILNDFVCGDGFGFKIKHIDTSFPEDKIKKATAYVEDFWKVNKIKLLWEKKCTDLSVNGMLILPVFVNQQNGSVKLGFIDPKQLKNVVFNPLNAEEITGIELKDSALTPKKFLTAMLPQMDMSNLNDESYGMLSGEVFYFAINNLSNQPEGVSDLFASMDWIDVLDQMIFNVLDNTRLQNIYVQKVILKGKSETQLKQWELDHPFPDKPSRFVGNEDTDMELMSPQTQGTESAEIVRIIKNYALATFGYPEMWFADGGNANLATATAQGQPVMKKMQKRQDLIAFMLEQMATFALQQGYLKKRIVPGVNVELTREDIQSMEVEIIKPEMGQRDLGDAGEALKKVNESLVSGVENGFISQKTAAVIFRSMISIIGYTVNEASEEAQIDTEKAEREEKAKLDQQNNPKPAEKNGKDDQGNGQQGQDDSGN